jgi:hypothetical protein
VKNWTKNRTTSSNNASNTNTLLSLIDKQGSADYYMVNYIVLVKNWTKNGTTSSNNASNTNTLLSSKYVLFLIHTTREWCENFISITQ